MAERQRPTVLTANVLCMIALAGLWIAGLIAGRIAPDTGIRQDLAVNVFYYLPFMVLPIVLSMRRSGEVGEALRLNPMQVIPSISVMFLGVLCVFLATELDIVWIDLLKAVGLSGPDASIEVASSRDLMLTVVNSAAVPAICEELLFRGCVLAAWERRGTAFAIFASSVLFALLHSNLFGLPAYLLVGLVSGFLVYALDSLYAGMLFHTVYNTSILVIVFIASRAEASATPPEAQTGTLWLVTEIMILLAVMAISLKSIDFRRRARGIEPMARVHAPLRRAEKWTLLGMLVLMALSMLATLIMGAAS